MTFVSRTGHDPFEGLPIGLYRSAPDGTLLYANSELVEMMRFPDFETMRRQPVGVSYPNLDDRKRWLEIIERDGVVKEFENLNRRHDGSVVWLRDSARAVRDATGKTLYYEGVLQDVTERKLAEDQVLRERAYFTQLFDAAPEAIALVDTTDRVIRINAEFSRLFGYSESEAHGKLLNDLIVPPERMEEGLTFIPLVQGGKSVSVDTIRMSKEGKRIPVSLLSRPFQAPGEDPTVYVIYRDITATVRAREELEKTKTYFQSLIEHATELVTVFDIGGRRLYASPSSARSLGFTREELLAQDPFSLVHPDDLPAVVESFRWLGAHPGASRTMDMRVRKKDGEWRILSALGTSLVNDPAVGGIVVNSRDVTEQHNLAEQLRKAQRMEAVGRLAGGVAHDFNNLLTVISTYTDFIQSDPQLPQEHRDDLAEIRKAADRAASLTRQLLAFGRGQVLQPTILDVNAEVRSATQMLARVLGENIAISIADEPALGLVSADPGQIQQVLLNLALNARDAMPLGGSLSFRTWNCTVGNEYRATEEYSIKPGEYVALSVADTGSGMDQATQRRIFEPFFSTKGQGLGTGLGLATVFGIVKQSGGYIEVKSNPGEGARFEIFLPRVEGEIDAETTVTTNPNGHGKATILLAEDEVPVREAVKRILTDEGHRVIAAANGNEALEQFGRHAREIDLLVTDIVMPEMGGIELAHECHVRRPQLPVLYMSGYADAAALKTRILEDRAKFIEKPFDRENFLAKLGELLVAGSGTKR